MSKNILGPDPLRGAVLTRPPRITPDIGARYWFNRCTDSTDPNQTKITADWLNDMTAALRRVVDTAGITGVLEIEGPNGDHLISEGMARYASGGISYIDTGSANAHALAPTGSFIAPKAYFNKMRLFYEPANTNTGPTTVLVEALGVKSLLQPDRNELTAGMAVKDRALEAFYDPAAKSGVGAFILAPWCVGVAGTGVDVAVDPSNRIINGEMRLDQRKGGGSTTPAASAFTVDRWYLTVSAASKLTYQRLSASPPPGLTHYLRLTVATAYTSGAGDSFLLSQAIEGYDWADALFGGAGARPSLATFYVRCSLTGTFPVSLQNSAGNRSYLGTVTIVAANTWERKSIAIPGDTTGTWLSDNMVGARLVFDLGSGSNRNGTANAWQGTNATRTSGSIQLVATGGATLDISGVDIRVAATLEPYRSRPIADEIMRCQRFYQKTNPLDVPPAVAGTGSLFLFWANEGGSANGSIQFGTRMRAYPTVTPYNISSGATGTFRRSDNTDHPVTVVGPHEGGVSFSVSTAPTPGVVPYFNGAMVAEAELI